MNQGTVPADDPFAAALRGFGPSGILAVFAILAGLVIAVPLSASLVLVWAWRSHTPWSALGLRAPRCWAGTIAAGIVFGAALKFLLKAVVMPLLGADPINQPYQALAGNTAAIPGMLFTIVVSAGFGEEILFRAYLFERLGKLLGSGAVARTATVLITSTWFGLAHYSTQGLTGVEQATLVGLLFGATFAFTGSLWLLISAHIAFDFIAYAFIYWDFETAIAHLLFK